MPQHSYTSGLGENLYELQNTPAWTAPGPGGGWHDALRAWYDDEAPKYDWSAASYWEGTGHFTQVRVLAALLAFRTQKSHHTRKCHDSYMLGAVICHTKWRLCSGKFAWY